MKFVRMPIEIEAPEERGYSTIRYNLAESSVTDRNFSDFKLDLKELKLAYSDHRGLPELRKEIASDGGVTENDVLVTTGAAGALFIIATTLLQPEDHLVVVRPNYATSLETPRAIGCQIDFIDLTFEDGFALDPERVRRAMRPNTKLISVTTPHNPTGVCLNDATLRELAAIAEQAKCKLLVDETYRDLGFGKKSPLAAALGKHVISVSSVSKAYGIPGIRIGWIACQDAPLMESFLAAKEQIGICGSIIDETVAATALAMRKDYLAALNKKLLGACAAVETWINGQDDFEWVKPQGGCVCFPRIRADRRIDIDRFYQLLDTEHGVAVGPGHWFEMDRRFMRVGFGWPTQDELAAGLAGMTQALDSARLK